jgi:Zn-dependent protease with chaperone function
MGPRPATSAYVITSGELSPGWLVLYGGTFAIQVVCAAIRGLIAYPLLWLILTIAGRSTASAHTLALVLAYGPLALSLATLVLPIGGWLWMQQSGGRTPSERERLIYDDALAILTRADPELRPPRRWFVLDEPHTNAAAYADTLMLTRGLLESGQLEPVLAHELGHLNSSDARLAAALHRLTTPPRQPLRFPLRSIGLLTSGALAAWITRAPWAAYWRQREYAADAYAAHLGQGQALARFLDTNALESDLPIPFLWLTEHTHPATEHRIDRLERQPSETTTGADS